MIKRIFLFSAIICSCFTMHAQELLAKMNVNASKVSTQVDKKVFQTLQSALSTFLNNRKWTKDTYQASEKIKCNFLITIDQDKGNNVYKGTLTVQAARPIYGTSYESPLLNIQDNDFTFRYAEFQPIEFNENRVQGNDPVAANLTAVLAYYVNIILGLDYDSFSPRGGDPYFQKALNIVNNAPESSDIVGWKPFDGMRNRFRLAENLTDNRFAIIHDVLYAYYRSGMDQLNDNPESGRGGVINALNFLNTLNKDNPNTMVMQVFFQGKGTELAKLFSQAKPDVKLQARDMLVKLDISNASLYKDLK
ncbi:MAG: DUF4835 domain-containing protein [Chitinophagaceae bacterium]